MRFLLSLAHPQRRAWLAAAACLLCAPALFSGWVLDDHVIGSRVIGAAGEPRWQGLLDAFAWAKAGQAPELRTDGMWPWWTEDAFKIHFLRPLTALTHLLDFWLLRDAPWLMHLESVLVLFALNLAVGAWYARLLKASPRALGIAFVLYVFAPGHAFAASWISNRNACLAALFGVCSLLAHDRGCREHSLPLQLLACVALLLSLASGEIGLSSMALLVAYTLCLDTTRLRSRLLALLPACVICLLWLALYQGLGLGTARSMLYVDARESPLTFARTLVTNFPILWFGQWGLPVTSMTIMLSNRARWAFAILAALLATCLAAPTVRVLRHDARARFGLLAGLLALFPVCSTVPHDRLLIVANVGACACIALVFDAGLRAGARRARLWRWGLRAKLAVSLVLFPAYAASLFQYRALTHDAFTEDLARGEVAGRTLFFFNPPSSFLPAQLLPMRRLDAGPLPRLVHTLASGCTSLTYRRLDSRTLSVRATTGFLQLPGTWPGHALDAPILSPVFVMQRLDRGSRSERPLVPGLRVELRELQVTVRAVTPDGAVREAEFRFARALEDASYRFLLFHDHRYHLVAPPQPGSTLVTPATLD
ncbi:MAG: hypothetical protein QM778_17085 [Myxococcales bacterium]